MGSIRGMQLAAGVVSAAAQNQKQQDDEAAVITGEGVAKAAAAVVAAAVTKQGQQNNQPQKIAASAGIKQVQTSTSVTSTVTFASTVGCSDITHRYILQYLLITLSSYGNRRKMVTVE